MWVNLWVCKLIFHQSMTCDYTLQYLLAQRWLIHPRALLTRNWFMQQTLAETPRFDSKLKTASSP
jgi:hypothetical protein